MGNFGCCAVDTGTVASGGGGGFLQAGVRVKPGEILQVLVGGGGHPSQGERGGAGGFNGGQAGKSYKGKNACIDWTT